MVAWLTPGFHLKSTTWLITELPPVVGRRRAAARHALALFPIRVAISFGRSAEAAGTPARRPRTPVRKKAGAPGRHHDAPGVVPGGSLIGYLGLGRPPAGCLALPGAARLPDARRNPFTMHEQMTAMRA